MLTTLASPFPQASIQDQPEFRYRGLSVDTSRNFLPMSALHRTVDAMAGEGA